MSDPQRLFAVCMIVGSIATLAGYYTVTAYLARRRDRLAREARDAATRQRIAAEQAMQAHVTQAFEQAMGTPAHDRLRAERARFEAEALAEIEQLTGGAP